MRREGAVQQTIALGLGRAELAQPIAQLTCRAAADESVCVHEHANEQTLGESSERVEGYPAVAKARRGKCRARIV